MSSQFPQGQGGPSGQQPQNGWYGPQGSMQGPGQGSFHGSAPVGAASTNQAGQYAGYGDAGTEQRFGQPQFGQQQGFGQHLDQGVGGAKSALPFTLREMIVGGILLLIFILSFLPFVQAGRGGDDSGYGTSFGPALANLWQFGWSSGVVLAIVAIVAITALCVGRLGGKPGFKVGSLSVDQTLEVTSVIAAITVWAAFLPILFASYYMPHVGAWLLAILSLAAVVLTVGAPFLPPFKADFEARSAETSSQAARALKPVTASASHSSANNSSHTSFAGQGGTQGYGQYPSGADQSAQHTTNYAQSTSWAPQGSTQNGGFTSAPHAAGGNAQASFGQQGGAGQGQPSWFQTEQVPDGHGAAVGGTAAYGDSDGARVQGGEDAAASPHQPSESSIAPAAAFGDTADRGGADHDASETAEPSDAPKPVSAASASRDGDDAMKTESASSVAEPFWLLVPEPRPVYEEHGDQVLFYISREAWAHGVEDRGDAILVQSPQGQRGLLRDVSGVQRA